VRALLDRSRRGRVLVIGDVMLDEFLWGRVSRISPEAPVPVVTVERQSFHVGGAANVAANVRALGCEVTLVGITGADAAGDRIRDGLARSGVFDLLLPAEPERPTTTKTRIVAHHQQVVRADREWSSDVSQEIEDRLVMSVRRELPRCHAVVLSDYRKGVVTRGLVRAVAASARRRRIPLLVDPKVRDLSLYRGANLITPNLSETEAATGLAIDGEKALREAGRRLVASGGFPAALVTRGEHGMSLFQRGRRPLHIRSVAREVFDVTGAGDTVIATLAVALAAGAGLEMAAALANTAAGVVVGKLGTALATPEEILGAFEATS
jgi:D-beta-D-heptose 7-phosphate kinase/D-beta-D-heptose 1-phosphate adenosyltransferase